MRRGLLGIWAVGTVLLMAGCGTPTGHPVAQTTPGRATSCTGDRQGATPRGHLAADARVVGALMCWQESRLLPGRGEWRVRLEARATGDLARQLDDALHEPDVPRSAGVACPAIAYLTPDLQVDLADGTTARPALPQNGCGAPLPHVAAVLDRLRAASAPRVVPIEQERGAIAVAAGCTTPWKDVLTGPVHMEGRGSPPPAPAPSARVGVCAYTLREGDLWLVRSGTTTGRALGRLDLLAAPDRTCPATVSGAVALGLAAAGPTVWVETGGCGRVVGEHFRTAGYLPAATVARLAALATAPEPGG